MDFASFIIIFLFGAVAGAVVMGIIVSHGDAVKLNEGFNQRYENFCKFVDERRAAQQRNIRQRGGSASDYDDIEDILFAPLPETEERYLNEDVITDKILTQIKPTLDQIEENTRYSSDHPTNIWREK